MKLAFLVTDSTHIHMVESEGLKLLNELQSAIPTYYPTKYDKS